jgi:hypothetical protein
MKQCVRWAAGLALAAFASVVAAELAVRKVERGKGAKAGRPLRCTWVTMTKAPSDDDWAGAGGFDYKVKKGDSVRVFAMAGEGKRWEVLYHPRGIEKLKR